MSTSTTLREADQALVSRLMGRLGYEPVARAGMQLRGLRNPDGSLRWVWPATLRQPLFLEFYSAATPKARLFGRLIRLAFASGLHRWLFPPLPGRFASTGKQSWPTADFALFMGTPGPFRKAVCCYCHEGQHIFAKLPLTVAAAQRVQVEAQAVQALASQRLSACLVPEIVAVHDDYLLQRSVKPAQAIRASQLTYQHVAYLQEQLHETAVQRPLAGTAYWQTVQQQVATLQNLPETRIPYGLRTKLQLLLASIEPDQLVTLAFAHGDFTPWNCWLSPDKLALYDLEFALPEAPVLYDLFHFHVQQGLLVSRLPVPQLRAQLWQQAWELFPAINETQLELALRLYLLHQISSYALVYHEQEQWHTQVYWLLTGWNALLTLELAATVEHRQLCLYDLLDSEGPQAGVVLKLRVANAYHPAPTSDVDVLLTAAHAAETAAFLRTFPLVRSAGVRHQAHMVSVDCSFEDSSFLSVDLLHQLERKGLQLLSSADVLGEARRVTAGIPVPSPRHDFEYTWLFYWLNHSSLPTVHRQHFEQGSPVEQQQLLGHLATKYGLSFASMAEAAHYQPRLARQLRQRLESQPGNGYWRRQWRAVHYGLSTVASLFRPSGFIITFSGVDGAGKSTVIEHVKERLEKKWRKRVVVIRHRPSVLPILSAWKYGRQQAEQRSVQQLPRQGSNYRFGPSLARFAYYYLDYLLGQIVVWLKYTRRGHMVLYDRYYFDFINDGRRSNISLPERLTKSLYALVTKPRLNFFLYATPEEILRRKKELSGDTITQLTQKYRSLFQQLSGKYRHSQYVPIENTDLDTTLALIGRYIQQEIQ